MAGDMSKVSTTLNRMNGTRFGAVSCRDLFKRTVSVVVDSYRLFAGKSLTHVFNARDMRPVSTNLDMGDSAFINTQFKSDDFVRPVIFSNADNNFFAKSVSVISRVFHTVSDVLRLGTPFKMVVVKAGTRVASVSAVDTTGGYINFVRVAFRRAVYSKMILKVFMPQLTVPVSVKLVWPNLTFIRRGFFDASKKVLELGYLPVLGHFHKSSSLL